MVSVIAIVAIVLGVHLLLVEERRRELFFLLLSFLMGLGMDSLFVYFNVTSFGSQAWKILGVPLWMLLLWPSFASTLALSMSWLRGRFVLAALFGLVGGPLSYLAGEKLGALQINESFSRGLLIVGLGWGLALLLLVVLRGKK